MNSTPNSSNPRLSDERREFLQKTLRDPETGKLSDHKVAKLCGVNKSTVAFWRARTDGAVQPTAPLTHQRQRLLDLANSGELSADDIATRLHLNREYVMYIARLHKITLPGSSHPRRDRHPFLRNKSRVPRPRDTIEQLVLRIEAIASSLSSDDIRIMLTKIERQDAIDWLDAMNFSAREITSFRNSLKEVANGHEAGPTQQHD